IVPGFVGMNPVTAVLLMALCVAIQLVRTEPVGAKPRKISQILGIVVAAAGAIKLLAIFGIFDAGIDMILFHDKLLSGPRNAMAPNTAMCFLLIGLGTVAFDWRTRAGGRPTEVFVMAAGILALVALVGYAYQATSLYGIGQF